MPNTDLTLIDIEEESNKEPSEKGRSKALLAAYAKLVEKRDLAHFKTMLLDHQKALAEDLAAQEAAAAEKESKKSKKSRKISEALDDDADIGGDPGTENMKAKKRKKAADDSDMGDKVILILFTGARLFDRTMLILVRKANENAQDQPEVQAYYSEDACRIFEKEVNKAQVQRYQA